MPLVWLGWQWLSATQTVDGRLTLATLAHFTACAACFYFGVLVLGRVSGLTPLCAGAAAALVASLGVGWDQHFGGIEETRRFFRTLNLEDYPPELRIKLESPEFRQKIESDRIWGTFFYPNAFAGGILLLLPPTLGVLWRATRLPRAWKAAIVGAIGLAGLAGLYWSGSKAGWLIALAILGIAGSGAGRARHLAAADPRRWRWLVFLAILPMGLGLFAFRHAEYFQQGAQSLGARFDYWQTGVRMVAENPWLGTGPGTFQHGYMRLKPPEAEPARLAHCDYLQQATDAGIVAALAYLAWIGGALWVLYRDRNRASPLARLAWLGLLGFMLQSFVEFGLYIPGLSWPAFLMLGTLLGSQPDAAPSAAKESDQPQHLQAQAKA